MIMSDYVISVIIPNPGLQLGSDSDDETTAQEYVSNTINNGKDLAIADPFLLKPPIDYGFSCNDFFLDDLSDSDNTITYDGTGN